MDDYLIAAVSELGSGYIQSEGCNFAAPSARVRT